jgi:glutathione S-transferase
MLKIYHSTQSRSLRVVWLCEELGLPYELVHLGMFKPEMKTAAYLEIHPLGKVPAIDDDGFVLWETAAIFDYLVAKYSDGTLLPPRDTKPGALAAQWMGFAENPLTVIMGEIAAHGGPMPEDMKIPALVDRGREIAPALVGVVARALGDQPFILGESFSAADIMLSFGLNIARYLEFVGEHTPRLLDYCERMSERPAYRRAIEAG